MVELAPSCCGSLPSSDESTAETGEEQLYSLVIENVSCPGCIKKIEEGVGQLPGVTQARLNFSTRRLRVAVRSGGSDLEKIQECLAQQGYKAAPFAVERRGLGHDEEAKNLLRRLAVAGFAAANVMLLSVSVWSGHSGDMGESTRSLFHWISALIAVPTVAYAGRPFFRSAAGALRHHRLNMDVPISLAILLACGLSFYRTFAGEEHIYFDAALMLLFFLLIGRYLDKQMRGRVSAAAQNLLALRSVFATVVEKDGGRRVCPVEAVQLGMLVEVGAGERIPVDGIVCHGKSELDASLISGESLPRQVSAGDPVFAGTLNLGNPLQIEATAVEEGTLISEMVRLMEAAEKRRGRYVVLADRMAKVYAPVVHLLAGVTLIAWWVFSSAGVETALMNAVAVLIITCPCALGLAVPVVQVIAVGRLLKKGVLTKAGNAFERLAKVDTVVFDKTGTLTTGRARFLNPSDIAEEDLKIAAALALQSRHPLAKSLSSAIKTRYEVQNVEEIPGSGLRGMFEGQEVWLGKRGWCGGTAAKGQSEKDHKGPELWYRKGKGPAQRLLFGEEFRPEAAEVISFMCEQGMDVVLLSGDRASSVEEAASQLSIANWQAEQSPAAKINAITELREQGRKVLMVGDGLNDSPALAAAHASISPASGADVSQTAADFVFQGVSLGAVKEIFETSRKARRLILENFSTACIYNLLAVPFAMAGFVTPLIAALAMSSSSLLVTLNAFRLGGLKRSDRRVQQKPAFIAEQGQ